MKTIDQNNSLYKITVDNTTVRDRCSIVIDPNTPKEIAEVIMRAWSQGYISCEVHFTDREFACLKSSQPSQESYYYPGGDCQV